MYVACIHGAMYTFALQWYTWHICAAQCTLHNTWRRERPRTAHVHMAYSKVKGNRPNLLVDVVMTTAL
jgi:hypothetical protein